jgi:hypothetical protein
MFIRQSRKFRKAANRNETLFFAALKTSEKQPGSVSYALAVASY